MYKWNERKSNVTNHTQNTFHKAQMNIWMVGGVSYYYIIIVSFIFRRVWWVGGRGLEIANVVSWWGGESWQCLV